MLPLDDSAQTRRYPIWTMLIILINVLIFIQELSVNNLESFIMQYVLVPRFVDFQSFESLIPFVTSQFLHGGIIHIASNMLFLWVFGDNVEERLGFILFPLVYLTSGIVGGLSQYLTAPQSPIPMLGASGAVAGVLGAYFVFFPRHEIKTLVPLFGLFTIVRIPAFIMLIYWFVIQLLSGTASLVFSATEQGGVAYLAHIGGFVTGWLVGRLSKL